MDGTAENLTLDELVEAGFVVAWPAEIEVSDHPGAGGPIAYLACEPLQLGASDGSTRRLQPGDVLHAHEARHAGTGLARMLRLHQVVAVPADRGVIGLARVLLERLDQLQKQVA